MPVTTVAETSAAVAGAELRKTAPGGIPASAWSAVSATLFVSETVEATVRSETDAVEGREASHPVQVVTDETEVAWVRERVKKDPSTTAMREWPYMEESSEVPSVVKEPAVLAWAVRRTPVPGVGVALLTLDTSRLVNVEEDDPEEGGKKKSEGATTMSERVTVFPDKVSSAPSKRKRGEVEEAKPEMERPERSRARPEAEEEEERKGWEEEDGEEDGGEVGVNDGGEGVGEDEEDPEKMTAVEEEVMERAERVPGTNTASTKVMVRESAAIEMTGGSGVEGEGGGGEAEGREQSKLRPVMVMSGPTPNVSGVRHVIWVSVTVMVVCVLTCDWRDEISTPAVVRGRRVSRVRVRVRVRRGWRVMVRVETLLERGV